MSRSAFPVSAFASGWAVWYRWPRREAISPPAHSFRQLFRSQERPDYVIVVAEKATLVPQLMAAERADIPVFLAFNSVIGPAHEQVGFPRQRFRQWLGSLVPVAEEGGYIAARALIQAALRDLPAGEPLEMIAIAGDRSTHTSMERNRGLERALNEFPQ